MVALDILLLHELELGVLDQFAEADHQAPGVGTLSLQAFEEDLADLLAYLFTARLGIDVQDSAREGESVLAGESQLVHDRVEETDPHVVLQPLGDVLEQLSRRALSAVNRLGRLVGEVEHDGANHRGVVTLGLASLFALLHLAANLVDDLAFVLRGVVLFEEILQSILNEDALIVGENAWLELDLFKQIDLQVLEEGVGVVNSLRAG
mmetsp:Transcript_11999/g.18535  ORF Transcript_11999/g.18535 Transcript_11999/m.18535 type:complete len:207 (+) Transcript_11999:211-831(+)